MVICSNCGEELEDESVFCHNCGSKIEKQTRQVVNDNASSDFEKQRDTVMVIIGYLALFVQLVSIFSAMFNVRVINSDRILLYPILCVMLSFYIAFNLAQKEKTIKHSAIIAAGSVLLFLLGIM